MKLYCMLLGGANKFFVVIYAEGYFMNNIVFFHEI